QGQSSIALAMGSVIRRLGASGYMAGAKVALAACVCFALTVAALNYIYAAGTPEPAADRRPRVSD
ncbi:hypothetical protein, partial [Citrobacter youngae]|uniref:hypothetical protein n=1 Tax=Citrobacter youngae TaxID=133448 RepID=UPI001954FBBB